jgi:CO dehydrogenase maturation factor
MKLGVVGKGGVGKTTVCAMLARTYARRGKRVVAIDTDSNPNLGVSLGLSPEDTEAIPVLPCALIVGSPSSLTAEQLLAEYGRPTPDGVTMVSAIKVTQAGGGCTCSGHATVRSLLGQVMAEHADVTLVDMEAGLEHLSRSGGTLAYADVLLVIMEPSRKSVITAARTVALAHELGIDRIFGLGNKARLPADEGFFADLCAEYDVPLAGVLPYDDGVRAADRDGTGVGADSGLTTQDALNQVVAALQTTQTLPSSESAPGNGGVRGPDDPPNSADEVPLSRRQGVQQQESTIP